ncbi:MAG TPA: c-type cytochrome [Burkholderiaceae bacterium]|nr:c-type cytochrome [Burkholderiaceae bacterium]
MRIPVIVISALWLAAPLSTQAEVTARQLKLLQNNCLQCHARENIGVPVMGRPEDWRGRNRQGEDALLRNVVQGMRGMPPLGYCAACDETDLRVLIRVVAGLEGKK